MIVSRKTAVILVIVLVLGSVPLAVAQQERTSNDGASADRPDDGTVEEEYTHLSVRVDDGYPDLKPGESTTVTIHVRNFEDEEVAISPEVEFPGLRAEPLPREWLEFEADERTIAPDEEITFDVTISVPEDADLARYHGVIAVTDEHVEYPGQPARPLHAATLGVTVYQDPTVHVVSQTYLRGQIEAGDSATAEIVIENTGEEAVPVNPEISSDRRVRSHPPSNGVLDPAWVSINAPGEISPGERETVEVSISPPEHVDLGNYRTELNLGIRDPARPEDDQYWQRITLNINVWSQPDEPYVRGFTVSEDTGSIELSLSPRGGYSSTVFEQDATPGSFDVVFISPDGERISPDRDQVIDRGSVDMTGRQSPSALADGYSEETIAKEFVYRVEDPAAGTWTVEIQPENTLGFSYEIVRDESSD